MTTGHVFIATRLVGFTPRLAGASLLTPCGHAVTYYGLFCDGAVYGLKGGEAMPCAGSDDGAD